jgi:plastocyanin
MTDEATPGETERGEPETPATPETPDAPEPAAAPDAPEAAEATTAEPEAAVPAVREEVSVPATVGDGAQVPDVRAEARKTRIVLPFLLPLGAILVVAFYTFNISRVFLASSENDPTPAVIIAAGITLAILAGASLIAAFPEIRTSSLVVGLSVLMLVVLMAGSLVLGASEPKGEASAAFVQPKGPAINTLSVDAEPTLNFQATKFNVPGGINQIKYVDKGGTHTLVFADNKVPGFELAVPTGLSAAKVDLKPNSTYTIYCTVPGHRVAGMEADIIVGAPGGTPEPGTQSPTQTTGPGTTQTTVAPGTAPGDPASQSSTGS